MSEINKRKKYFLVVDVETANAVDCPLVYDIGWAICDKQGEVYEKGSILTYDIFYLERGLMCSAYYAEKLPRYGEGIRNGEFEFMNLQTVKRKFSELLKKYNTQNVCAYNANFDRNALDNTLRYITKSQYRYFFPYGVKIHCIWHMACQTILQQKTFLRWAIEQGFVSEKGNIKTSAEIAYRYLTADPEFVEQHTGLADVEIECRIMARCFRQKKKMNTNINRSCWRLPTAKAKEFAFA